MPEIKLSPYIVPYKNRKNFRRKVRNTEREIQNFKKEGKWKDVARLGYILRNALWGYKKYK